jgi:hypothetical protein
MHVTVDFLGLFFRTGKIFFGLTRFSCLSVRMTDNFSASFGKSARNSHYIYYHFIFMYCFFVSTEPRYSWNTAKVVVTHQSINHVSTDAVGFSFVKPIKKDVVLLSSCDYKCNSTPRFIIRTAFRVLVTFRWWCCPNSL